MSHPNQFSEISPWFFFSPPARRSAPPLDIVGLPGYDKLLPKEKEVHLIFTIKNILITIKYFLFIIVYRNCPKVCQICFPVYLNRKKNYHKSVWNS